MNYLQPTFFTLGKMLSLFLNCSGISIFKRTVLVKSFIKNTRCSLFICRKTLMIVEIRLFIKYIKKYFVDIINFSMSLTNLNSRSTHWNVQKQEETHMKDICQINCSKTFHASNTGLPCLYKHLQLISLKYHSRNIHVHKEFQIFFRVFSN